MKNLQKISIERADRLRKIRAMAGLTRKAVAEKYQIPPGTLQNWEVPRFGGLTERGAQKIIRCMAIEGVYASVEWLMLGVGAAPTLASQPAGTRLLGKKLAGQKKVDQEIEYFKKLHKKSVVYHLKDQSMQPQYQAGDVFVGVSRVAPKEIKALANRLCILQIDEDKWLLRYVKEVMPMKKKAKLFAVRPNIKCHHTETEMVFKRIWLVVWVRRQAIATV